LACKDVKVRLMLEGLGLKGAVDVHGLYGSRVRSNLIAALPEGLEER